MNALSSLVNNAFRERSISRSRFIQKTGYKNISKGLRRFDAFLEDPQKNNHFVDEISKILDIPSDRLLAAIKQTRLAIEDLERTAFKPFIQITLDKRPSPIFIAAMLPGLTRINVPESITELQFEHEIALITDLYRKHRDKHSPAWPSGNGFCYYRRHDEVLRFDRDCKLIDEGSCSPYSFSLRI